MWDLVRTKVESIARTAREKRAEAIRAAQAAAETEFEAFFKSKVHQRHNAMMSADFKDIWTRADLVQADKEMDGNLRRSSSAHSRSSVQSIGNFLGKFQSRPMAGAPPSGFRRAKSVRVMGNRSKRRMRRLVEAERRR